MDPKTSNNEFYFKMDEARNDTLDSMFRSHFFNFSEPSVATNTKSSTSASTSSTRSSISTVPTNSASGNPSTLNSGTISAGQGAGIAVGSVLGLILLTTGLGYILQRRRLLVITQRTGEPEPTGTGKQMRPSELGGNCIVEAEAMINSYELEGSVHAYT